MKIKINLPSKIDFVVLVNSVFFFFWFSCYVVGASMLLDLSVTDVGMGESGRNKILNLKKGEPIVKWSKTNQTEKARYRDNKTKMHCLNIRKRFYIVFVRI